MASSDPSDQALGELYELAREQIVLREELRQRRSATTTRSSCTATQRPTSTRCSMASYTYSKSKGNYPGLFSTETGQLDPNITSLYDLPI